MTATQDAPAVDPRPAAALDPEALVDRIEAGHVLTAEEAVAVLDAPDADTFRIVAAASRLREKHFGRTVKVNYLVSLKTGLCPENCTYCSQRLGTEAEILRYTWLKPEEAVRQAGLGIAGGASRVCMVASGTGPTDRDVDRVAGMVGDLKAQHPDVEVCACLGFLKDGQAERLKAGAAAAQARVPASLSGVRAARGAADTHSRPTSNGCTASSVADTTPIGEVRPSSWPLVGATNRAASSIASGRVGHWSSHERVSSSASHLGLDACICAVVDTRPSRRRRSAECRAANAAGAASGSPVQAGSAASTAAAPPGWASAHSSATAAPIETPPTAIANGAAARAALSRSSR